MTVEQSVFKGMLDIVVSTIGIVISTPFSLGTAIAIKLHDGRPVLFKQDRLTVDGKVFELCKFRSMITEAEIEN